MGEIKTEKNLYDAFVGEAKAALRLKGYAEKAEEEGYSQMAKLFRAIAFAEEVHGLKHLKLLEIVGSTEENLQASFESETSVTENVYPEFIRIADEEGNQGARISFTHARDAEEFHARLYKGAIDRMIDETEAPYHVCTVCGYVAEGEAPEKCPVCDALPEKFMRVD